MQPLEKVIKSHSFWSIRKYRETNERTENIMVLPMVIFGTCIFYEPYYEINEPSGSHYVHIQHDRNVSNALYQYMHTYSVLSQI